ncbi:galectin 9B [Trichuris trichiura]|uniref:Galectin n=1 Tax=Trichuris trichiura TaxID=36087 RepID=A0A077YZH6_TRITR|nr:galectin 9B [Trichuris trichiura]
MQARLAVISAENFTTGSVVLVSGEMAEDVKSLIINLVSKANKQILFHFNPRFLKKKVYRNAKLNNTWGKEEFDGDFPFSTASNFTIMIVCQTEGFRVFVDQAPKFFFAHRETAEFIDTVYVEGNSSDIVINDVGVY